MQKTCSGNYMRLGTLWLGELPGTMRETIRSITIRATICHYPVGKTVRKEKSIRRSGGEGNVGIADREHRT